MDKNKIELICPSCNNLIKKINESDIKKGRKLKIICKKCNTSVSFNINKEFVCNKCNKGFKSKKQAEEHEKLCKKQQQRFELFCPYCNSEMSSSFNLLGQSGDITCGNCEKNFKFAFGKVISATGFTGYVAKGGFLRMLIAGKEEEISWYVTKSINLKRNDLILIIWKKRLFNLNENKPYQIFNYTTGTRNQL